MEHSPQLQKWTRGGLLLLAAILLSCEGDSSAVEPVVGVSVQPDSVVLRAIGDTVSLRALVDGPDDASGRVTWRVEGTGLAVSPTGVVTALSPGAGVVIAEVDGIMGAARIGVEQTVSSVRLSSSSIELDALGAGHTFAATVHDANGHPVSGARVRWSSSDTTLVRVDSMGGATAVAPGTAQIRGEVGSVSAAATAIVRPVPANITLVSPPATIEVGEVRALVPHVADRNGHPVAGATVTWETSAQTVLTVNATGSATGVGVGRARVTARSGAVQATADIDVVQTVATIAVEAPSVLTSLGDSQVTAAANGSARVVAAVGSISDTIQIRVAQTVRTVAITPATAVLASRGAQARLAAAALDARGNPVTNGTAAWSSSRPSVAAVSLDGMVTAGDVGAAVITAIVGGISATAQVQVGGVIVASLTVAPDSVAFRTVGVSQPLTATARDSAGAVLPDVSVEWTSSNPQVAEVNFSTGRVVANSSGTAVITARAGGAEARVPVTVTQAVVSLELGPDELFMLHRTGIRTQIYSAAQDSLGRRVSDARLDWVSRESNVVQVDQDGWITSVAAGRTRVVASHGDLQDSVRVHVYPYSQLRLDLEWEESRSAVARTSYRDTLVAVVRDTAGAHVEGVRVIFRAPPSGGLRLSPIPGTRYWGPTTPATVIEVWTDAAGRAPVRVLPHEQAGDWPLVASIDDVLADTLVFTVLHGPVARALISGPSAVSVGDSKQFTVRGADRYGNQFDAAGTFATSSVHFTTTSAGLVSGVSVGVGHLRVEVTHDGVSISDSVAITTVPPALIVREVNNQLVLGDLSGEGTILGPGEVPSWSAEGDRILYTVNGQIRIRDMRGSVSTVPTSGLGAARANAPVMSADGEWIYFEAGTPPYLWRVRPDGSGLERLLEKPGSGSLGQSISPDGKQLAIAISGEALYVMDVTTRALTRVSWGLYWRNPRWSPDGRWIAAMDPYVGVVVMRPDGTDRYEFRGWASGYQAGYHTGLTWSPDGKWIVLAAPEASMGMLLNVQTREGYRIPWPNGGFFPAWQP